MRIRWFMRSMLILLAGFFVWPAPQTVAASSWPWAPIPAGAGWCNVYPIVPAHTFDQLLVPIRPDHWSMAPADLRAYHPESITTLTFDPAQTTSSSFSLASWYADPPSEEWRAGLLPGGMLGAGFAEAPDFSNPYSRPADGILQTDDVIFSALYSPVSAAENLDLLVETGAILVIPVADRVLTQNAPPTITSAALHRFVS